MVNLKLIKNEEEFHHVVLNLHTLFYSGVCIARLCACNTAYASLFTTNYWKLERTVESWKPQLSSNSGWDWNF